MSRRTALVIITAVLAVAAVLALLVGRHRKPTPDGAPAESRLQPAAPSADALTLYFPGDGDRLEAEQREVTPGLEGTALARRILDEVLAGPADEALYPPLPEGTAVDFVRADEAGTLWVSLAPPAGSTPPRYGSRAEILAVYSLVNSLCVNLPDVDRVALLWNGVEPTTFAGHVDTRHPLTPQPRWVRSSG